MTLTYIRIPMPVLTLKGYSASKKILLALVASFNSEGLKASNKYLAEILDVKPDYISDLLCGLESSGDIKIENRQSRHRVIYFGENSKVKELLLREKVQSKKGLLRTKTGSKEVLLRDFSPSTSGKSPNTTKESNKRHTCAPQKPPMGNDGDKSFQRFYSIYPKKIARIDAQKSWAKLNPSPKLVEQIISAVERQKQTQQWLKEDGKYIPYPATWLNKCRWEDETPENPLPTHEATEEEAAAILSEVVT